MIKIVTGLTGEGKTKKMIASANEKASHIKGTAVYIDTSTNHRYALSHKVRLIETSQLPLNSLGGFIGFLCGVISSNHDIEVIFVDELFKLTKCHLDEIPGFFETLKVLSQKHDIELIIGTSCSKKDLPQHLTPYLTA